MLISRKSVKLHSKVSRNQVGNVAEPSSEDQVHRHAPIRSKEDIEISQYPTIQYFCGFATMGLGIYLIYSATGGVNSIPGFNDNLAWQYFIAIIILLIGVALLVWGQAESVLLLKEGRIIVVKAMLFTCRVKETQGWDINELVEVSVGRRGFDRTSFKTTSYHIVLNFRNCQEVWTLSCSSELVAKGYLETIRGGLPIPEIASKKGSGLRLESTYE